MRWSIVGFGLLVAGSGLGCVPGLTSERTEVPVVAMQPAPTPALGSAMLGMLADPALYPDLQTEPPTALELDHAEVDGSFRQVLRFTNGILNAGEGPVEVIGTLDGGTVAQRVYRDDGTHFDRVAGQVVHHESHNHWHFQSVMRFEVWRREVYEQWLLSGRTAGEPEWKHSKLSSCLLDSEFGMELPGAAGAPVYTTECLPTVQGISVGWIDIYDQLLPDQWVALDATPIPDGDYVLRSVTDPENLLHESNGGLDQSRESEVVNDAIRRFSVRQGELLLESDEPALDPSR